MLEDVCVAEQDLVDPDEAAVDDPADAGAEPVRERVRVPDPGLRDRQVAPVRPLPQGVQPRVQPLLHLLPDGGLLRRQGPRRHLHLDLPHRLLLRHLLPLHLLLHQPQRLPSKYPIPSYP